ncbi:MAG: lysyl oxidase family protein, partial [Verrucomicrobiota bacterium]
SRLSFTSVAGTTYYIAVDGLNAANGTIALNWSQTAGPPPPANDGFAAPQLITGSIGTFNNSTANATKEPGEPNHAANPGGASVWYQWTAPTSNSTVFDTFGSSFDTLLAVYSGNSVAALTPVASNNDLDTITKQSRVSISPVAGTTYYIAVDGFGGASGNFVLSWNQSGLGYLPDLVIRASAAANYQITNLTFISTDCAVVEGLVQAGTRRLLVFTTETRNMGSIDWYEGNPVNSPDFIWAPCHAHYHFNNYMLYQLLDNNGQSVAVGLKVGFCLTDSLRWDATANATHKYHCGLQGIQKGWGDVYTYLTAGQWVDVTGLPDGNYTLQMTVNPLQRIQESDYSNNTVLVPIVIGQAPPPNDNFSRAQIISGSSGVVTTVNTYGTKESGEPNHAGNPGGHSIWYSWTAPSSQSVNIDTVGSSINTLLAVYTGTGVGALNLIASNDDLSTQSAQSRVIFNPVAATTYMIVVDGNNGVVGNVTLNWTQASPPANDNFVSAQILSGLSGSLTGDNLLATKEPGEPNHAAPGTHSIWFKWTPNTAVSSTIDTIGSNFDTLLAVYTGTSVSALTIVASNDDIGGGVVVSRVTFNSTLGTTYRIAVDGYNAAKGNVTLNWNQATGGSLQALHPISDQAIDGLAQSAADSFLTGQDVLTGGFLVTVRGRPGDNYALQVSTDLTSWTYLHTLPVDAMGLGLFIDRSKPPGRVNLLDPWCGKPNDRTYQPPVIEPRGVYYRAVLQPAAIEITPLKVQPKSTEQ